MLPGEVGVARQDDALRAVLVIPDGGRHLAPVGDVDDEGADGVGAVVEADGVFGSAHGPCYIISPRLPVQQIGGVVEAAHFAHLLIASFRLHSGCEAIPHLPRSKC